jgi:hypothetical protein
MAAPSTCKFEQDLNESQYRSTYDTTYELGQKRCRADSVASDISTGNESPDELAYEHSGFCLKNFEFYFGKDRKLSTGTDDEFEEPDDNLLMEAEAFARQHGGKCLSTVCESTS